MSLSVQLRRGTAAQNSTFTGSVGELIYTTDTKKLFVHDGTTVGGVEIGAVSSLADDSVTFAKIEEIPANTILGNNTGSSSDIIELSVAQTQSLLNVANGATANDSDANLKNRSNHTGTQTASTISDFNTAASSAAPVQTSDIANFETTTELNTRDTNNRNRTNHTGTQLLATISDAGTAAASNTGDFAAASHNHTAANITDFDTEVANNSAVTANTAKISYTDSAAVALNTAKISYTDSAAVALNTAKVTNATHTGDVTGSTALTIANNTVNSNKLSTTLDFGSIT